ncbi:MAG: PQQ-like beta-propeller repeat protein, partial [Planctomycetales bacterium]
LMFSALAAVSLAGDWNQWRGPNRDGAAGDSPPLISSLPKAGLKPLWTSEEIPSARSGGWSSPVVAGGKTYVFTHSRKVKEGLGLPKKKFPWLAPEKRTGMTAKEYEEYERNRRDEDERHGALYGYVETVYCLDAATGKTLWKNERDSAYTRFLHSGSPAVIDGRIHVLGAGRTAHCVDASTGRSIWTTKMPGDFRDEFMMSSFAVADGAAVVLAGSLFGLDAKTGELLWQGDPKSTRGTHSSPVVWKTGDQELIVVNVAGSETICLEPRTGKERWRAETQAGLSTPVLQGDLMITSGNSRKKGVRCFRMSLEGAEEAWAYQGVADKGSSPVIVAGHLYVQGERRLSCVDLQNGEECWSTLLNLGKPQYTSLLAADGKVLYALDGLLIFAADPQRFRSLVEAKFDAEGLMASEASIREMLDLDALEKTPEGQKKARALYQKKVGGHGPLVCATPAIANGKLYVRFKNRLACYDLTNPAAGQ